MVERTKAALARLEWTAVFWKISTARPSSCIPTVAVLRLGDREIRAPMTIYANHR